MNARRGFTLLELTITCMMLAAMLAVCLQLLGATAAGRRASALRQTALEEATNALERIYAIEFRDLTSHEAHRLAPSDRVAQTLPAGRLDVAVDLAPEVPTAKRIAVAVAWRARPEEPEKVVRLVAWKYPIPMTPGSP